MQEYTVGDMGSVFCREVVPFSEDPLSEVPLYITIRILHKFCAINGKIKPSSTGNSSQIITKSIRYYKFRFFNFINHAHTLIIVDKLTKITIHITELCFVTNGIQFQNKQYCLSVVNTHTTHHISFIGYQHTCVIIL